MNDKFEFIEILKNKILSFQVSIGNEVLEAGLEKFELNFLPAGSLLTKAGASCDKIFFTHSSIVRCYLLDEDGEEKTVWIEPEQSFVTDFFTLFNNSSPSSIYLYMYEDSYVLSISNGNLQKLFEKHHEWALLGIKILSKSIEYAIKNSDVFVKSNAEERYRYIEEHYPRFLQVVPLHHIASRLNVSPVTISRVRAKKKIVKKCVIMPKPSRTAMVFYYVFIFLAFV